MAIITGDNGANSILGSATDDEISGLGGDDFIDAGSGNDLVDGGSGFDYLIGGDGDDTLLGGSDGDTLTGGKGNDLLDGGPGFSGIGSANANYNAATGGVTVSLSVSGPQTVGADQGTDTLVNIQNLNGSAFNDSFTGDAQTNSLNGNDGDDTLAGLGGSDFLDGRRGDDSIDGGAGVDMANYGFANGGVTVSLSVSGAQAVGADQGTDTLVNIENLNGGAFNDSFTGDSQINYFAGNGGDDTLSGGDGADVLDGGTGDDRIDGGLGAYDFVAYFNAAGGVSVDLSNPGAQSVGGGMGVDTILNMENVLGGAFGDNLTGDAQNNYLGGNDGNDTLSGGGGDDNLEGGTGDDRVDGGGGRDMASYFYAPGGVTVDLTNTGAQTVGAGQGVDTLLNMENLNGGAFDDNLTGDAQNNYLGGNDGNDTLSGGGDDDNLGGGAGDDWMDGGAGTSDNARYFDATGGVTVDLSIAGAQNVGGGQGVDTLINIENLGGGAFGDSLAGNAQNNSLQGEAGDDTLSGGGGADNLNGGAGNDSLAGGADSDFLTGGTGDDLLDGGLGVDTASYESANASVTVNLSVSGPQAVGADQGTDTLVSIENLNGSAFNDTLAGDSQGNVLNGNGGDDSLFGAAGVDFVTGGAGNDSLAGGADNDYMTGGSGDDVLDGGSGLDTANYQSVNGSVTVNLSVSGAQAVGADLGTETLVNIENVYGGNFNDSLVGDAQNNLLVGLGGADTLVGGAGDDNLLGAQGDDLMDGGANAAVYGLPYGALGGDGASYFTATGGVTVSLAISGSQAVGGGMGVDTLINIEHLYGGSFDDSLTGDGSDNYLLGQAGNDTLAGGVGHDLLEGAVGNDLLDGGAGDDLAVYSFATSGVTIDLAISGGQSVGGGAGVDTFVSIEGVSGSAFNDSLMGDAQDNVLTGGLGGADTLMAGAGDDTLTGAAGNDTLNGGDGADTAVYLGARSDYALNLSGGVLTVTDLRVGSPDGTDTLQDIETLIFTDQSVTVEDLVNHPPTAVADAGSVAENQSVSLDVLANDTDPDGGDTLSLVSVSATAKGASVSIVAGQVVYTANADSFDPLTLGQTTTDSFSYTMRDAAGETSTATVTLTISGIADAPTVTGGNGSDSFAGTAADDVVNAGNGADQIYGQAGADTLDGGNGGDGLFGGAGIDRLSGGNGEDLLDGGTGDDVLSGGNGNDTLQGGDGNDSLSGGNGADTLGGGAGDDTLTGNNGSDRFVFGSGAGHDRITDFGGGDRVVIADVANFAGLMAHAQQVGGDVVITLSAADSLTLQGVGLSSLNAGDFVFG